MGKLIDKLKNLFNKKKEEKKTDNFNKNTIDNLLNLKSRNNKQILSKMMILNKIINLEWKIKDGKKIKVKDMTDKHIQNTVCYLLDKRKERKKKGEEVTKIERWLKVFGVELRRREKVKEREEQFRDELYNLFDDGSEEFLAPEFGDN